MPLQSKFHFRMATKKIDYIIALKDIFIISIISLL